MWESRVLCEISKALWKPFCGFHSAAISTAVPGARSVGCIRTLDAQGDREALAAGHLVAEHELQQILVRHLLLAREHESVGQRVEHAR